jgi:hypothetical protein
MRRFIHTNGKNLPQQRNTGLGDENFGEIFEN